MSIRTARRRAPLLVLAGLLLALLVPTTSARGATFSISLPLVASGFQQLTQVTNAGDGSGRLFMVERRGVIYAFKNGSRSVFLDIRSLVDDSAGERGLLGLAFHPSFATNHRFFVYYTRNGGDIVVARFTTNAAGTSASGTGTGILVIEHSAHGNHNGGSMAFGPDGLLYIGVGDGGGSGDPGNNAQSKTKNLLGKILRININATRYSIPSTNPFRGSIAGRDEIWAYGLRNPWRISFDRGTGMLFIADVGQSRYEEIDREPAGYHGGRNYGWRQMEGKHCFVSGCTRSGKTLPVAEYPHRFGCSITGGYVYRGATQPKLVGAYFFADFCSGRIWSMPANGSGLWQRRVISQNITSFGEGDDGELYAATYSGRVYQIKQV